MNGITHRQAKRYLRADLDGLITDAQRRALETHLAGCEACRLESQSLSSLTSRLQTELHARWDLRQDGPSERVLKNIQSQSRRIKMQKRMDVVFNLLGGTAALLVLFFVVNSVISKFQKDTAATNGTQVPASAQQEPLIAFVMTQDYVNGEIYTMKSDGSEMTNLTNNPATDDSPAWSPDGKHIAFVSDRSGGRDIYIMNADGSNVRKLTDSSTFNDHFTWSPDGTKIAYLSSESFPNTSQIIVMNADGSNKIALTSEPGSYSFLGWSPDGQKIVYEIANAGDHGQPRILFANIDGTGTIDGIAGIDFGTPYQILWENNEQLVLLGYNFNVEPTTWQLSRMFVTTDTTVYNGFGPIIVTSHVPIVAIFERTYAVEDQDALRWFAFEGNPIPMSPWYFPSVCETPSSDPYLQDTNHAVSPDRTLDFVYVFCKNDSLFYLVNDDGTKIIPLNMKVPRPQQVIETVWSPDGKAVVVTISNTKGTNLYRFDIEKMLNDPSTQPVQLTTDDTVKYWAVWQPIANNEVVEKESTPEPLFSFTLTIAEAEVLAGFDILEPAYLPDGYALEGAAYDSQTQKAALRFISQIGDKGILDIYQQCGELTPDPAIQAYITPIVVGDAEGEYVHGAWIYDSPNTTSPRWDPRADTFSLSWEKDGFVFSINFLGGETIIPLSLNDLIAIAESMK